MSNIVTSLLNYIHNMIIKSTKENPLANVHVHPTNNVHRSQIKKKHKDNKQFMLTNSTHGDKNLVILFDTFFQRVVYTHTSLKDIDTLYREVFKQYNRREIKVVDPEELKHLIQTIKDTLDEGSVRVYDLDRTIKQISREPKSMLSAHAKSIIETYRYIDKYRVGLLPHISFSKETNTTTIDLYDDEDGISKGMHKLVYEHNIRKYKYFYLDNLIKETNILEEIFK